MKQKSLLVCGVTPSLGLPGGIVSIACRGYRPGLPSESRVMVGEADAGVVSASEDLVVVRLPENPRAPGITLHVGGAGSPVYPFTLGVIVATGLHPVTSPVISPDGSIITTISGSRGEQISQPLVRVTRQGEKTHFPCEIANPTGLAFGPDGQLYVSSRSEGVVYRYTNFEQLDVVADGLGICCGLAFDSGGRIYVGDRTGKIHRVDGAGNRDEFAQLEPSVSAYHLAMDPRDNLYVSGPTISMRDPLYKIDRNRRVSKVLDRLARPQGMAFAPDGTLWIAAAHRGKKGVFKYFPDTGAFALHVAAPMLVGLAISREDVFMVDSDSVYWLKTAPAPGGGT